MLRDDAAGVRSFDSPFFLNRNIKKSRAGRKRGQFSSWLFSYQNQFDMRDSRPIGRKQIAKRQACPYAAEAVQLAG